MEGSIESPVKELGPLEATSSHTRGTFQPDGRLLDAVSEINSSRRADDPTAERCQRGLARNKGCKDRLIF